MPLAILSQYCQCQLTTIYITDFELVAVLARVFHFHKSQFNSDCYVRVLQSFNGSIKVQLQIFLGFIITIEFLILTHTWYIPIMLAI